MLIFVRMSAGSAAHRTTWRKTVRTLRVPSLHPQTGAHSVNLAAFPTQCLKICLYSPTPARQRNLRVGSGPQGSRRDWILNQCYTSCVPASAIFNTQGEILPGGKGKSSACVGRCAADIIIRMKGGRSDTRRMGEGLRLRFQSNLTLMRCGRINLKMEQKPMLIICLLHKVSLLL